MIAPVLVFKLRPVGNVPVSENVIGVLPVTIAVEEKAVFTVAVRLRYPDNRGAERIVMTTFTGADDPASLDTVTFTDVLELVP